MATIESIGTIAEGLSVCDKYSDGGYVEACAMVHIPLKGDFEATITMYDGYPEHAHLAIMNGDKNIVPDDIYLLYDVMDYFRIAESDIFFANWKILTLDENREELEGGPQDNEQVKEAIRCLNDCSVKFTFEKGVKL